MGFDFDTGMDTEKVVKQAKKRVQTGPKKTTRAYVVKKRLAAYLIERPKRFLLPLVLKALYFVLSAPQRFLDSLNRRARRVNLRLENFYAKRPLVVVENYAKPPFPPDMRAATTRLALLQLQAYEGPEPTRKDIVEAYRRAEMVRGDGKLPVDPRTVKMTKGEVAVEAQKERTTEEDLVLVLKDVEAVIASFEEEKLAKDEAAAGEEDPTLP